VNSIIIHFLLGDYLQGTRNLDLLLRGLFCTLVHFRSVRRNPVMRSKGEPGYILWDSSHLGLSCQNYILKYFLKVILLDHLEVNLKSWPMFSLKYESIKSHLIYLKKNPFYHSELGGLIVT
jgi:hypothetical protein